MHSYTDSFDSSQASECPLCTEEFDMTDKNLKPCKCGYQVCLWCLNRLMETANGDVAKCPNCRRPYDQKNFDFKPLDPKEIKAEKSKQKSKKRPHKSRKSLANVRVIQRNLVYVVGLTLEVAKEAFLADNFVKYGKISKLVVNTTNLQRAASQGREPTVSAYITYERPDDAAKAIQAVDSTWIDGKMLRASFGTTKYCAYFLRSIQCTNPDCMYLHEYGHDEDTFTKDDIVLRNGLPTPNSSNDGYLEIYSALKDTSNVVKHHWNWPRSNQPPSTHTARSSTVGGPTIVRGSDGFETNSFWDVPEDDGGEYEGYDYYDDDLYLHESQMEEEPLAPPEPKPKVAIANPNKTKDSSSLPSTARWGIQADEAAKQAAAAKQTKPATQQDTLQPVTPSVQSSSSDSSTPKSNSKSTSPSSATTTTIPATTTTTTTVATTTTAAKKQKKKTKKSKKSPQQTKKSEPKRGPVMIQEPQFDKPKKSTPPTTTSSTQAATSKDNKDKTSTVSNTTSPSSSKNSNTKDTAADSTPIDSLKMLNAESTLLPSSQNISPSAVLSGSANQSPLDVGLFGRDKEKTFPNLGSQQTSGAELTAPLLQDSTGLQTQPPLLDGKTQQQPPFGAIFSHHHHQSSSTMSAGMFMQPQTDAGVPQLGSVPSLWSSGPMGPVAHQGTTENHLTQSRFAYSSTDDNKPLEGPSETHSRFAPFAQHDMQDALRSLLPNVKVNFSFGGTSAMGGTADAKQQQPPLLHQGSTWGGHPQNININIHNTNFIQNNHSQFGGGFGGYSDAYAQPWGSFSASQPQQQQHQPSFFHS